ncbi:SOS response-associated peptidase [Halieaceae bacterium IMCC14734]|uniref:Abasic site processing protein n=1 Tax=Candidatus Litorirhabdus singularis TaxID=2518993 RepID=A0ABT3TJV6_9GAMM|nr:SOS response-associated peptidase [Candidatus Litorirhabdus singularis]MCX2982586.1 SOS response-associated peptidase [Candidatus Litorirhabdus singularis]
MCGRFNVIDNPELQRLLQVLGVDLTLPSRSNIAPTETIAMVRQSGLQRELAAVRWWLTPAWAKQVDQKYAMFNARSETIASSRAFGEAFKSRRGIVPMSSFIEWRKEEDAKQPYLIAAVDQALPVAAVWEIWQGDDQIIESCALLTTAAAPEFEQFHKRMPVVLREEDVERWLDPQSRLAVNDPIFAPQLSYPLRVQPLAIGVNNARNKDLDLLQPTAEGVLLTD